MLVGQLSRCSNSEVSRLQHSGLVLRGGAKDCSGFASGSDVAALGFGQAARR